MTDYRYAECGLENVVIRNVSFLVDDAGEKTVRIPNVNQLHTAIASSIIFKPASMTGKELRFLRTEMGRTQAELAALVHREPLAISRWERGEVEQIDANAEALIRLHAREVLKIERLITVEEISRFSVSTADTPIIEIDGSDPKTYRPIFKDAA